MKKYERLNNFLRVDRDELTKRAIVRTKRWSEPKLYGIFQYGSDSKKNRKDLIKSICILILRQFKGIVHRKTVAIPTPDQWVIGEKSISPVWSLLNHDKINAEQTFFHTWPNIFLFLFYKDPLNKGKFHFSLHFWALWCLTKRIHKPKIIRSY